MPLRTAIYARVSTLDQNPQMQLRDLRQYAKARKMQIAVELVEKKSSVDKKRPERDKLLELVRKGKVQAVLVWKFDRFARSSKELTDILKEFQQRGIQFISYTENIDTATPGGELVYTIFGAMAQFERSLISERVRSGMARAREEGKHLGRSPIDRETVEEIRKGLRKGRSLRVIASSLGVSKSTVAKYRQAPKKKTSKKKRR